MARLASLYLTKRSALHALGTAGVVLLFASGFAFVYSLSVDRVADNAKALHWVDSTMASAALARAGLVQATTLAGLDATDAALDEVKTAADDMERLADLGEDHDSSAYLTNYLGVVSMIVTALEDGDLTTAEQQLRNELEVAYISVTDSLQTEHEAISAALEDDGSSGRAINGWVLFVLVLAVPATAISVYTVLARRQVRAHRARSDIEIAAERATHRAKDQFIAALSHELRTPLTAIYGYAAIQADGGIMGPEAVQETGQIIASEAAEMARMVDDLLIASSLTSGGVDLDLRHVKLHDVIESAVMPYERAGRTIERHPALGLVNADADRLRHVLVNLISNAVKHGGPAAGVNVAMNDESVEIEVWDNGRGLPPDRVDLLFSRHVRDPAEQLLVDGVGLGLAVSARLTALMGGELKYQRFANKTFFVVCLTPAVFEQSNRSDGRDDVASMIRALSV